MPTTYAHHSFGERCLRTLPESLRQLVAANRAIFDYGVHGPDIYFYYHALTPNAINDFGRALHDIPFSETLAGIRPRFTVCDDRDAALSYLLGFTAHFALDAWCHGYVERKAEVSGISHNKLESQYDRYLMLRDGLNPVRHSRVSQLKPERHMGAVISALLPEVSPADTFTTLRDQRIYLTLLKDSNAAKRLLLRTAMDLVHANSFKDLLITEESLPGAADAMLRLDKLTALAAAEYPVLAENLTAFLSGEADLLPAFGRTFGPASDYRSIPVLPLEEEQNYTVPK